MDGNRLVVKLLPEAKKRGAMAAHRALQAVSAECGLSDLIVRSAVSAGPL